MKTPFFLGLLIMVCVTGCFSSARMKSSSVQEKQNAELIRLGKAHYERGDLEAATKSLLDCLRADPKNGPALYYLNLVREAEIQQSLNKTDPSRRLWFPTMPPRPVE